MGSEVNRTLSDVGQGTAARSWRKHLAQLFPLGGDALLVALVVLGFVLRSWWMVTQTPVMSSDGAEYGAMAEHLFHNLALVGTFEGSETLYAPLYPVLIAGTMLVIPNSELAAHIVSLLFGTALILIVFLIAQHIYDRRAAYICAVIAALHPLLVALSGSTYNETVYLTMLMAAVYWGLRALDLRRRRDFLLAGMFLGLSYLTRVESFAYVLFFVGTLLTAGLLRKRLRIAIQGSSMILVAFFVVASPYIAFFYEHTGTLRLEAKWDVNYTMARNRLAGMNGSEADYGLWNDGSVKGPILAPGEFATYTPYQKTVHDELAALAAMAKINRWTTYDDLLSVEFGSPLLLALVTIGLIRQPWSNRRFGYEVVLLAIAGSIVFIVLTASATEFRYFLPILPLLLLWGGKGVDELGQWIRGWEFIRTGRLLHPYAIGVALQVCAVALVLMLSVMGVQKESLFVQERSSGAEAARDAGIWLEHYEPGPKRIAVRHPLIPYYAKGTLIGLPYADQEHALRYLTSKNVDFIVLESRHARNFQNIGEWITNGIPDRHARLIYDRTNPSGDRVVIYRWVRESHV